MRILTISLLLLLFALLTVPTQAQDICLPGQCDPPVLDPDASFTFDLADLAPFINTDLYISLSDLLGFDDPALGFDDPALGFETSATQAAPVRFAFAVVERNSSGELVPINSIWVSDPVLLVPGTPGLVLQGKGPIDTFWDAFDSPLAGFDDPALGFDDPALGFDDPALGFDDPALGFVIECDFETPEIAREELEGIWGTGGVASDINTDYALILAAQPTGLGDPNALVLGDAAVLPFDLNTSLISNSMHRVHEDGFAVQELAAVALEGHYPEPFNPATTIRYTLPEAGPVRLAVYDLLGREVALLAEGIQEAGTHEARFDAAGLPSGTYLYRIEAGSFSQTRPMTLMK